MRRLFLCIFTITVFAMGGLGAAEAMPQTSKPAAKKATAKNPVAATPASIAAGKALFQKYCRFCHGDDAKGDGPQAPEGTNPPNLVDEKWDHGSGDADIFATIKNGVGPRFDMKSYDAKLMPQDIWNLVNYLRSIGPHGKSR